MPTIAELFDLAVRHHQSGDLRHAEPLYRQILGADPDHAFAHNNLGIVLYDQKQLTEAAECFRRVLRLNPKDADAHNNLGNVLRDQGLLEEALSCFQRALQLNSNSAEIYNNLGVVLKDQGHFEKAAECYRQALRKDPNHKLALWNLSFLRLLHGDWEGGWPDFELRFVLPGSRPPIFQQPRWDGSPLKGKTILVYAEGGLGDTFQFLRYLPLIQRRGGTVVFECQASLFRMLRGVKGINQLIPAGTPRPPFDVQISSMSLPGVFRTTLATLPADNPYLAADAERVERWRRELDVGGSISPMGPIGPIRLIPRPAPTTRHSPLKVGIVWQAHPKTKGFSLKSCALKHLEPLAQVEKVRLVSLQVGPQTKELAAAGFPVADLGSRFDPNSLEDLAAAVANMDLVVTVDTAVAHLAGAMGLPVWVALAIGPDWRWLLERSDSPWYPTMRLFRQNKSGDWTAVFERMAVSLRDLIFPKDQNNEKRFIQP